MVEFSMPASAMVCISFSNSLHGYDESKEKDLVSYCGLAAITKERTCPTVCAWLNWPTNLDPSANRICRLSTKLYNLFTSIFKLCTNFKERQLTLWSVELYRGRSVHVHGLHLSIDLLREELRSWQESDFPTYALVQKMLSNIYLDVPVWIRPFCDLPCSSAP